MVRGFKQGRLIALRWALPLLVLAPLTARGDLPPQVTLATPGSAGSGSGAIDRFTLRFSQAMVALEKGKFTETPVKSQFGYHVIRLDDVRDAQLPKFEDVKPQISQQLMQQKMAKFQEELRAKAKVE